MSNLHPRSADNALIQLGVNHVNLLPVFYLNTRAYTLILKIGSQGAQGSQIIAPVRRGRQFYAVIDDTSTLLGLVEPPLYHREAEAPLVDGVLAALLGPIPVCGVERLGCYLGPAR